MKSLVAVVPFLLTLSHFAQSDVLNQSVIDGSVMTRESSAKLRPLFLFGENKAKFSDSSFTASYRDLGAEGSYGLSESLTLGTRVMVRETRGLDQSQSGLVNPELFARAKATLNERNQLFYGLNLAISPNDGTSKNQFTGGNSLELN
ncbi:hypothetical protein GW916_00790, partial [bacterium]|nr:hypothetical protein [bacterium]